MCLCHQFHDFQITLDSRYPRYYWPSNPSGRSAEQVLLETFGKEISEWQCIHHERNDEDQGVESTAHNKWKEASFSEAKLLILGKRELRILSPAL